MIRGSFRPWGNLDWLLKHIKIKKCGLLGAIATGERSLTTWAYLKERKICVYEKMLQIRDLPSPYWGDAPLIRTEARRDEFETKGGNKSSVVLCDIRDNLSEITNYIDDFVRNTPDDVIIDISTLPKRFFFIVIKELLRKTSGNNIIVTYTRPRSYDALKPLAINPGPWRAISGFRATNIAKDVKALIVALGYEPLGLPQILSDGEFSQENIHLFFPFPATPSGYLKNWEFVRNLDSEGGLSNTPHRVNGFDVSSIFDLIYDCSDKSTEPVVLAPYGTKPMSLAMCLYACRFSKTTDVYYTQPQSYNPFYSSDVETRNGVPVTYAYCVRLNGRDLYV